jgi:hypothetical protein
VVRRPPQSDRLNARVVSITWWLVGTLHRWVARVLGGVGWLLGHAVRPFPWSCRLAFLSALLGLVAVYLGTHGTDWLLNAADFLPEEMVTLAENGIIKSLHVLGVLSFGVGLVLLLCVLAAFVRHWMSLVLLKVGATGFAVIWGYLLMLVVRAPALLHVTDADNFDKYTRNEYWMVGVWAWVPAAIPAVAFLVCLVLRPVTAFYTGRARERETLGDRIVRDLRTHGGDPRFRSSSYWSAFLHISTLFAIPMLMRGCGMERAYGIPKGSGEQVVQLVKIRRIKKKKKEQFVLNMDSPIIFYRPEIDESEIMKEVDKETLDTYVASSLKGKLGKGGKGKGGWPHGMENARVRFIRLEYRGGDWDQDMGVGADYNLLIMFQKYTGFKIAENTEHLAIGRLRRFPKHRGPPFVFITGAKGISVTRREIQTLRWYCLEEGGLIFADNGGGYFNNSFRSLMRRVFPDAEWVDIASDDILFQQPYLFPNGAPPLWHHSGNRMLGLKHQGRWVVVYHQGDLNDAWKTGHSGVSKGQAIQAYKLGVNVINYAFNQYMNIHYGD